MTAAAQTPQPDSLDSTPNESIIALAVQADSKILVGGRFTTISGVTRNGIARLNTDGTLDAAFNPDADSYVFSLAAQADGKILVGGTFMALGGVTRNRIARLNADGTLDAVFNPNANSAVYSLAVQADGKILVGGTFTTMGGVTRNCIARLNADGTLDAAFNPDANNQVNTLVVQADGKILVGGWFTTMGGVTRNNIARLNADGTLDGDFNPDADSTVHSLVVQPDGKILVGGYFWAMGGVIRSGIARLNMDGTLDTAFDPNASNAVLSMALQADGKILVGGYFTAIGEVTRNRIARLNADGTLDDSFNPDANDWVFSLAVQADGKIVVGGEFTTMGGLMRTHIARLTNTGTPTDCLDYSGTRISWLRGGSGPEVWRTTFEHSPDGTVYSMLGAGSRVTGGWELNAVPFTGGTIRARGYTVGGQYNGSGGIVESGFGNAVFSEQPENRTNSAGTTASFVAVALGSTPLAYRWRKNGVDLSDGGNILGSTTATLHVNGVLHGDMGGYDVIAHNGYGSITSVVATLTVADPAINVQPSSRIGHVGGDTTFSVTASGTGLLTYQWLKNGLLLTDATNTVLSMTNLQVLDVGNYSVVICGAYGCVTSEVCELSVNLASVETTFNPNADSSVSALALQTDGKILLGGQFSTIGGVTRNSIARLNVDGTLDTAFISGPSEYGVVKVLSVQPDGKILVGGWFGSMSGQPRNSIARLNADGTIDTAFNPNASYWVLSMAVQADGKILVGGMFTTMSGAPRNYIARLNADGTLDTAFNPNANSFVYSLALQPDGKILIGGQFTAIGGVPRNCIARLNADGTLDTAFNPNPNSYIYSLAVQADGKILVGGWFTTMGGVTRNRIARLNLDGTPDTAFSPDANARVDSLAVQTDGKILVGGLFTTIGGVARNYIARLNLDGTPEATFNPDANNQVNALTVQADGKVLAGGLFTGMDGLSRNYIARLNSTGPVVDKIGYDGATVTWLRGGNAPEVWRTTFECVTNGTSWKMLGAGTRISGGWKLAGVSSTGKVIRARGYTSNGIVESLPGGPIFIKEPTNVTCIAGATNTFIATASGSAPISYRWRKDGTDLVDSGKVSGASTPSLRLNGVLKIDEGQYDVVISNPSGCVTSGVATLTVLDPTITVQPVSQVSTEGSNVTFSVTAVGTGALNYQWRKNGVSLTNATSCLLTFASALVSDTGNYDVVISGTCGSVTSAVAVLTVNLGMVDRLFNPNANGSVYTLAVQPDGKMLIGGSFTTIGGVTRNRIARLNADGTLDTAFNPNAGSYVYALTVQADGKILVGGWFTTMGGVTRNRIARLNADGTLDTAFNPNANHYVYSLVVQADGKILVSGEFTTMGGVTRYRIARLNTDGTIDNAFAFNQNAGSTAFSLALQTDGKILVGGGFTTMGGVTRNYIARLNADGTLDTAFNPDANNQVNTLVVQADGKILVGGSFSTMGGVTRNRIARLNADGTLDATFNPNASSTVFSLGLQADGKILVGGYFTTIGGVTRNYIARLNADGTLDAAFNPDSNNQVNALAIQTDGKILIGGEFTKVNGLVRNYIARLNSTGLPVDTLGVEGGTVTWLRGGTAPEVLRTTFEYATNGTSWTMLGTGARIPGGWRLTGVSATGRAIRARGYTTGGQYNGSCGIVENSWGSPVITEQRTNLTCRAGMTATFEVAAAGSKPMSYQWSKDGINVDYATNSTLILTEATRAQEGNYRVTVSNAYGTVTSLDVVLVVVSPLTIVTSVLPIATVGYPYSAVLQATGGIPPYCWSAMTGMQAETATPNSFSSVGVAQWWRADDATWNLQLPFQFKYYGNAYTQCWVDSNGRICFNNAGSDTSPTLGKFAATPMIAALWRDLDTRSGNISVSTNAEEVAIRWNGTYYGSSSEVNFAVVLGRNGKVTIKYGGGNVNGGMIGVSDGTGTNYIVSAKSQAGSMSSAPDIVFSPIETPPFGIQLSTNGVLTGIPSTVGNYWPTFVVTDSGGVAIVTNIMMQVANAVSLNILSDHGITQPSTMVTNYGAVVSESLTNSPVVNNATQYVCKGWSLAGVLATHGQASGDTTTVAMTLTNNATLTWLWTTNCWFQREAGADGAVSGDTNGWYALDSHVTVTAAPNSGYRLAYWTGDVPAGHTHDNPLVLAMDAARSLTAHFTVITLNGFDVWMQSKGLSGDPAIAFTSDRNSDNIANGFEYAFGTNWSFGQDMLNIRLVNRETVVEFPMQDSNTIPYVSLTLKGCTNLLCLPGDWTLQTAPATNTTGKPANRNWYVPVGVPPTNAFFRLNATLLP